MTYGGSGEDSVRFDTITLYAPNFTQNFFIAKFDSNGNVIWAIDKNSNNPSGNDINPSSMSVDIYNDIYVIGSFLDTFIVDGIKLFSTPSSSTNYVIKFNSDGAFVWAHTIGGVANFIINDNMGNIYITGLTNANDSLFYDTVCIGTSSYRNNMYIAKFDSGGHSLWVRTAGDNAANVGGTNLAVDLSLIHI